MLVSVVTSFGEGGLQAMNQTNGSSSQANWTYRLPVEVDAGEYERYDKPVDIHVDFTEQLSRLGMDKAFDKNSIRVVEVDSSGKVLDGSVVYQFDESPDYDAVKNASGTLVFILKGTTSANIKRIFYVYFDDATGSSEASGFPAQVSVTEIEEYEGDECFKIATQNADYYYHKHGSGFASLIDADGNDWIGFHPTTQRGDGPKGEYRGIPNVAPPNFHPGRGEGKLPSKIVSQGPLKTRILSETEDRQWVCTWDIYPNYATMTLFKKGEEPYWILYEGTPGGEFGLDDYWVLSSGERLSVAEYYMSKNQWKGKLPSPKWVYFGDGKMDRVLYLSLHEDHDVEDIFWHFGEGGMTVFGIGRGPTQEKWQQLEIVPAHFTIGFAANGEFESASKVINSACQKLKLFISAPEMPADRDDWGGANVINDGDREAYLENSKIRVTYARHGTPGRKVTDRIVEFLLKDGNRVISNNLDGRHTPGEDKAFYRLTDAKVEYDGPDRKTVMLNLGDGARVEHLTIFKDLPILKIAYDTGGHNLEYGKWGGKYEIYGADKWQELRGWDKKYPALHEGLTESDSYYRGDWGDAGPLSYKGYMILETHSRKDGMGLGVLVPVDKIYFLKLQPNGGGFERFMKDAYTLYIYPVTGGGKSVLKDGKKWVDRVVAGDFN